MANKIYEMGALEIIECPETVATYHKVMARVNGKVMFTYRNNPVAELEAQYLVTQHSPYMEWYQPPQSKLFTTRYSAEEYKAQLEAKQPEGSVCFISITELVAQ